MKDEATPEKKTDAPRHQRLMSLDALRGFDMFWIIGGNHVFLGFLMIFMRPLPDWIEYQFHHVEWEGFAFWDLIMPLFLFMSGTSMPFSFAKRLEGASKVKLYLKIVRRVIVLFVLGMIAQGNLLEFKLDTLHLYCNTLQSIAAGYLIAALIVLNMRLAWQIATTCGLLVVFWLLMILVPVPEHGAGVLTGAGNLAMYIDEAILGRFRDGTTYTWILSSLTFGASVMLGALSGEILRRDMTPKRKLQWLTGVGVGCLAAGWLWGLSFPIIKHIWTSSMVLWAGGLSFLLLALFYWVIDVRQYKKWAFPFIVIGTNAIGVYMATHLISFRAISGKLVGGLAGHMGLAGDYLQVLTTFAIIWLILLHLYRKKTFIRV
jgi:predicted acyltransferase